MLCTWVRGVTSQTTVFFIKLCMLHQVCFVPCNFIYFYFHCFLWTFLMLLVICLGRYLMTSTYNLAIWRRWSGAHVVGRLGVWAHWERPSAFCWKGNWMLFRIWLHFYSIRQARNSLILLHFLQQVCLFLGTNKC